MKMTKSIKSLLLAIVAVAAVGAVSAPVALAAISLKNYFDQPAGGSATDNVFHVSGTMGIESGGTETVKSGGTLAVAAGGVETLAGQTPVTGIVQISDSGTAPSAATVLGTAYEASFQYPNGVPVILGKGGIQVVNVAAGGTQTVVANFTNSGAITLSGGTGTATVVAGCKPICTNVSTAAAFKCSVSSTTLTAASGAGTDTINYLCF